MANYYDPRIDKLLTKIFEKILKAIKFKAYAKYYNRGLFPLMFYSITLFGRTIETCQFNKGD
jgi:hypothetical protein